MIALHRIALLAAVAIFAATTLQTQANPLPQAEPKADKAAKRVKPAKTAKPAKDAKVKTDTRVYLMRGLLNVFSLGMDTLSERLTAMGFESEVYNHNSWLSIANKIAEDRKRGHNGAVVLIGHSLGADVMFQLTNRLEKENIPVRLAVFFDPTISHDISKNVEHVLNLYQLNGFGRKVTAPKGYKGDLVNMDLSGDESIGHGSIDKSEKLHDLVVEKIMKVAVDPVRRKRPRPAKPQPVATVPPPVTPAAATPAGASPKTDAAPAAAPPASAATEPAPSAPAPSVAAPSVAAPSAPAAKPAPAPAPSAPVNAGPLVPRI